ncbi:uncharacterized protein rbbp8l isoform X2 [Entelurus aequoreus]|uniref:uncharacterized protein rbbp8l isoform X2 n=1 Tax=Entelurus aequoreus TaxID=161455 RepID=UPI002B1DFD7F|nr:uncharacterized protein rbbp8l isoform X2 [Entelurus aequoreus]
MESFNELLLKLREVHERELEGWQMKVQELSNKKGCDTKRMEELFARNQQMKEQQRLLTDNIKTLENRLRAGLCDRCTVTQDVAKRRQQEFEVSQMQTLHHVTLLGGEINSLKKENRRMRDEIVNLREALNNTPSEVKPNISPGLSPNSGPVSLSAAAKVYARPDQPADGDVAVKTDTHEHQSEFRQLRAMSKSHFPISLSTYTSPSWKTEHNAAGERRAHIAETIDHHPLKTSSLSDLSPHSLKAPVPCRPQPIKSTFPWAIPESAAWAPMAGGSMVLHPYPKSGLPGFPNMVPTSQNGSLPGYGPQWHKAVKEPTVVFRLKNPSEHAGQSPVAKTQDKKDAQHKDPCDGPLDLSDRGKSKTGQTPLAWQEGLDRRRDKDVSPDASPSLPPVSQREEVPNHKAVKEQEQNKAAQGKAEQSKKVPTLTISLRPVVVLETLNSDLHTQNTSTNGKSPADEPESSEGQVEEEEEEEEVSVSGQDQDQVSKRRRLSVEADLDLDSDSDSQHPSRFLFPSSELLFPLTSFHASHFLSAPAPNKKVKMGVRTQEKTSC